MGDTKQFTPNVEERFKDASREDLIKAVLKAEGEASLLYRDGERLKEVISELSNVQFLKRLEFLFKIVENSKAFDGDTIIKATDEIKEVMFPKKEEKEENNG